MSFPTTLSRQLAVTGRLPKVRLEIKPLNGTSSYGFDQFTSYQFSSSIVVPVDAFQFEFCAPGDSSAFPSYCREGDIVTMYADNKIIATGIVDQIEVEVDGETGERARVIGRDLMGQLEDHTCVKIVKKEATNEERVDIIPIWGQNITLEEVAKTLADGTRIKSVVTRDAPVTPTLFASEPGESRISSLLRMAEPLNSLIWSDPNGNLIVGRPNFAQASSGKILCSKEKRESNVLSIRATYSATSIPNKLVVIWSEVQNTQTGIPKNQVFDNAAVGPTRLRQNGHNVIRTTMTSLPNGADAQSLAAAANFQAASAANQNLLQALAKRQFARENMNELIVQAVVPGHFNDNGVAYRPDQTYMVEFDRGAVNEKMYLFAVEWNLDMERGQYTNLWFCRLGTIVSDARIA
jgi:prophage tail gpP-like protein